MRYEAAFIYLTVAYDVVWKYGLLLKLAKIILCELLLTFLGNSFK